MHDSPQLRMKELAKPIFERYYMVGIRFKDTMSIEDVKKFGVPTVGIKEHDERVMNDLCDRYMKICEMVEYYKNGIPLVVRNPKETEDIYNVINAYLRGWHDFLEGSINTGNVPIDDLVNLDRFASSVYEHAVNYFSQATPLNGVLGRLYHNSVQSKFISYDEIQRRKAIEQNPEVRPENINVHDSMEEFFSKRYYGRR